MRILLTSLILSLCSCSALSSVCSTATFKDGMKHLLVETSTRVKMVTQEEDCQVILNVLLVGGGGDGDIFEGHAGGSGFVDFKQVSYCRLSTFHCCHANHCSRGQKRKYFSSNELCCQARVKSLGSVQVSNKYIRVGRRVGQKCFLLLLLLGWRGPEAKFFLIFSCDEQLKK